jgi:hypothetical protein
MHVIIQKIHQLKGVHAFHKKIYFFVEMLSSVITKTFKSRRTLRGGVFLTLSCIFLSLPVAFAQHYDLLIEPNPLDEQVYYAESVCTELSKVLLKTPEFNRRTFTNDVINSVIVEWMRRHPRRPVLERNYFTLKLYNSSFERCPEFRKYYHLLYDGEHADCTDIVALHRRMQPFLLALVTGDELSMFVDSAHQLALLQDIQKVMIEIREATFYTPDYSDDSGYSIKVYQLSPDPPVAFPIADTALVIGFGFRMTGDKVNHVRVYQNSEIVPVVQEQAKQNRSLSAPPPPPIRERKE